MGVRKSVRALTTTERDNFLRAFLTLKATIANPAAPASSQISIYDQFVAIHLGVLSVNSPTASSVNTGHQGNGFGPWQHLRRD